MLQELLIDKVHLHVLGFIDNPPGLLSLPEAENRHCAPSAVRIAEAHLDSLNWSIDRNCEGINQLCPALNQPSQHLLTAVNP